MTATQQLLTSPANVTLGQPIVRLDNLHVSYQTNGRSISAVRGVSLEVRPGETVAVVGESGSGKSTTATAALGLLPAEGRVTAGNIEVKGRDVTNAPDRVWRGIRGSLIGLVPQDPMVGLNPTQRIGHQVAEAVRKRGGVDRRSIDAEVVEVLEQAGLDNAVLRARQYPHELSGGMRQRALIAVALAGRPELIIADEPTSALDVTIQRKILDHLEGLVAKRGIALLIITHDLAVAADRADRVIVMHNGEIVESGVPNAILRRAEHPYTRRLLDAAPGLANRGDVVPVHVNARPTEEVLRVEHLVKDFELPRAPGAERTVRAVDDVSLTAYRGQTLAIVGESGSGKTTLLRIALGLERPTAGTVFFDGREISGLTWNAMKPLRRRFQLVQQNPFASLDPRLTILESITEPLASSGLGDRRSRLARAKELLEQVALPQSYLNRLPRELSGGQRQRVAIARALSVEPELLFLDEPVSALDVSVQAQILALLAELQEQLGLSYVFVSHDLAVVARISHRVAVMSKGSLVEEGTADDIFLRPQHDYTKELLGAIPGKRHALHGGDRT
jgi:peptide/nickel transport system ATP-binding protein